MVRFFPSIHPSLLSSRRNASKRTALPEAVLPSRKPMRKNLPVGCAVDTAATVHKIAATKNDAAAAFFIAYLVWVAIYHASCAKEKRYLRGKAPMFRRGKR